MRTQQMDEAAQLESKFPVLLREKFHIPTFASMGIDPHNDNELTYLCGNSLGLMPRETKEAINRELDAWAFRGVEGHFNHPSAIGWVDIDLPVVPLLASLVGAKESEVAIMNSLTANLNALLVAFYRPKGKKTQILFERGSFPSDYYAFHEQSRLQGLNPQDTLLQLEPRPNEYHLRTEDILKAIYNHRETLALVCLPGIQYYTGQWLNIGEITKHAHRYGITVGWDLAHAVGNVPLKLHDWGVDFACWCSYKYLNSGPGAMGGAFVHETHSTGTSMPRLAGWWGNNRQRRFAMLENFEPIAGALGFRQSNPSVIDVVSVHTSLQLFQKAGGIEILRERSLQLTGFLQRLLQSSKFYAKPCGFVIITPTGDVNDHGAQLSLLFDTTDIDKISQSIRAKGLIADERRPNVIRLAPAPLYNTFQEVYKTFEILQETLTDFAAD